MQNNAYYTYNAVDVAYCLLKHARAQEISLTNLQLQKLTYVCHGLSLAHHQRPLVLDDVFACEFGSAISSIYFRFRSFGADPITEVCDVDLDVASESIVREVVERLGHLSSPQLAALTHREGSPSRQMWDGQGPIMMPDA